MERIRGHDFLWDRVVCGGYGFERTTKQVFGSLFYRYRSTPSTTFGLNSLETDEIPHSTPFACSFNQNLSRGCILAVADEEGNVHLLRAENDPKSSGNGSSSWRPEKTWRQHQNAIFDLAWAGKDEYIWTASGDQSIRCYDLRKESVIHNISGHHTTSVKNIALKGGEMNEIASSGRDGKIALLDTRQSLNAPVAQFYRASMSNGSSTKRRKLSQLKALGPGSNDNGTSNIVGKKNVYINESITGLQFVSDYWIAASYAPSGDLLLWDTRYSKAQQPSVIFYHGQAHSAQHSLTGFVASGSMIYGTSTDHHIYAYCTDGADPNSTKTNLSNSAEPNVNNHPIQSWTSDAFSCKSFYVKSALSLDSNYLLTGSSLNSALIWDVSSLTNRSPMLFELKGHEGEVTSVAWCQHSPDKVSGRLLIFINADNSLFTYIIDCYMFR
jgi:denticleless